MAVIKAPTTEFTNCPELICDCTFYTSVCLTVVDFEIGYGNNLDNITHKNIGNGQMHRVDGRLYKTKQMYFKWVQLAVYVTEFISISEKKKSKEKKKDPPCYILILLTQYRNKWERKV